MIIEISVALIAIALVALSIYLIITLRHVVGLIHVIDRELAIVHENGKDILVEGGELLKTGNAISKELYRKLVVVDPLFSLVGNLSSKADLAITAAPKTSKACDCSQCQFHHPVQNNLHEMREDRVLEISELLINAFNVYRKIKGGSYGKTQS